MEWHTSRPMTTCRTPYNRCRAETSRHLRGTFSESFQKSLLQCHVHVQISCQECPRVADLFNLLGDRLPRTVSGFGLDADEYWRNPSLVSLQRSRELEAVPRHHAIIVIGCGHK